MIADLKSYPALKYSDVSWLGAVPKHWDVRRLGQIGRLSKGNGGNKDDEVPTGVPCVRYGDLYTTHTYVIRRSRSFVSQSTAESYTPIKFGDVLFAASGETYDEIGKSAVNLMQSKACCGGDVILFRPEHPIEAQYMGYATDCHPAAIQKATMGRGITVKHIYGNQLKSLTLALPPLAEQAAISRFLDYADRRIRRYIGAKQKMMALLEEQRQAIIQQAVTGQIEVRTGRPYPTYKPSGVEWLGDVPKHWEVRRLKALVSRIDQGVSPQAERCLAAHASPYFCRHQITPKTSRYTRCSMSMLPNVSINRRIRSSGQLGRWWYSISPCRNNECVRRFTVFAFNQRS